VVRRWARRFTRRRVAPPSRSITERQLVFDGMLNFRDLGGLPAEGGRVRGWVLFRSDSLAYATPADAKRLVDELGVATIIDLRGRYEVERLGRGPLADTAVNYVSAPIVDVSGAEDLARHYVAMLDEKGAVLGDLIRMLAGPGALPAVFHCEAGCDRTGVLAAVVLGLLGVSEDLIAEDYALTAPAMPAIHARVRQVAKRLGLPARPGVLVEWAPEASMMAETLKLARERWGGIGEWAALHGVGAEDIAALRAALIEPI
jgi:protein-tyrosine phosphatase